MTENELDNLRFGDKVICISRKIVCKFLGREFIGSNIVIVKDLFITRTPQSVFLKNYQKVGMQCQK